MFDDNVQRDTQGTKRAKGHKQHSSSRKTREWRFKLPTELALGKSGKLGKKLENFFRPQAFTTPQIHFAPAAIAVLLSSRSPFTHREKGRFQIDM